MTREQKMQAVVDAARTMAQRSEAGLSLLDARIAVTGALAALDAHTEAEAQEVVTLAVWKDTDDGEVRFVDPDGTLHEALSRDGNYRRLGTVTLPLTPEGGR